MATQNQFYNARAASVLMYAGDMYAYMYVCKVWVRINPALVLRPSRSLLLYGCDNWAVNGSGSKKIVTADISLINRERREK
jgi:hypothetical protein